MNQTERDKFLTEAMGECWHEPYSSQTYWMCKYCGAKPSINPAIDVHQYNNNFSTWAGFGKLWEWAILQEWYKGFVEFTYYLKYPKASFVDADTVNELVIDFINPTNFANAVYSFLKERS